MTADSTFTSLVTNKYTFPAEVFIEFKYGNTTLHRQWIMDNRPQSAPIYSDVTYMGFCITEHYLNAGTGGGQDFPPLYSCACNGA